MQLRQIRWSDFRNSHACCMQISGAAGHYTHKLLHRRASPRTNCSLSCSWSWGGLITVLSPFNPHSNNLGHSGVQSPQFKIWLRFLLLCLTNEPAIPHFAATCSLLRNQVVVAWSQTPDSLAPHAAVACVTLSVTPWDVSTMFN